jgi:hypothetical protein
MSNWVHDLPVGWLIVLVLAGMSIATAVIYAGVMAVASADRGPRLEISPGMLPPMALVFGLLVGFLVAQLWSNAGDAREESTRRRAHCGPWSFSRDRFRAGRGRDGRVRP